MSYLMHAAFTVHLKLELGDEGHELKARINYSVSKGYPDTREQPGCGPSVSINAISVDGINAPGWLFAMAEADEALTAELLQHAADTDEHDRDQAADSRREELRMERGA